MNLANGKTPKNGFFQDYSTIDTTFQTVHSIIQAKPDKLQIDYDSTYGYPRRIIFEYDVNTTDDEYSITLGEIKPINP